MYKTLVNIKVAQRRIFQNNWTETCRNRIVFLVFIWPKTFIFCNKNKNTFYKNYIHRLCNKYSITHVKNSWFSYMQLQFELWLFVRIRVSFVRWLILLHLFSSVLIFKCKHIIWYINQDVNMHSICFLIFFSENKKCNYIYK